MKSSTFNKTQTLKMTKIINIDSKSSFLKAEKRMRSHERPEITQKKHFQNLKFSWNTGKFCMHAFPYERTKRQGGVVWKENLDHFCLLLRQKKCIKNMHTRQQAKRANPRAVFGAHDKKVGGGVWKDCFDIVCLRQRQKGRRKDWPLLNCKRNSTAFAFRYIWF